MTEKHDQQGFETYLYIFGALGYFSHISLNPHQEASADSGDLNDSVHDDENVDTPNPGLLDNGDDENLVNSQISIANLSAG